MLLLLASVVVARALVDELGAGVLLLELDTLLDDVGAAVELEGTVVLLVELGSALVVDSGVVVQSHAHAVDDVAAGVLLEVVGAAVLLVVVVSAAVLLVDGVGVVLLVHAGFAIAVHEQAHVHMEQPAALVLLDVVGAGVELLDVVAAPAVVVLLLVTIAVVLEVVGIAVVLLDDVGGAVVLLVLDVGAGVDEELGSTVEVPSPKGEVDVLLSHTHWSCNTEVVAEEVVLLLRGVDVTCAIRSSASVATKFEHMKRGDRCSE